MPRLTYYNQGEIIEHLRVLAWKLLMSNEVQSLDGPHASRLFDLVGDMHPDEVEAASNYFGPDPA